MRLALDPARNLLRLTLTDAPASDAAVALAGTLDVAANGRLAGIELRGAELPRLLAPWTRDPIAAEFTHLSDDGSAYIALTVGPAGEEMRSSDVPIVAELDGVGACVALAIPRRGHGYEISYPSGNR